MHREMTRDQRRAALALEALRGEEKELENVEGNVLFGQNALRHQQVHQQIQQLLQQQQQQQAQIPRLDDFFEMLVAAEDAVALNVIVLDAEAENDVIFLRELDKNQKNKRRILDHLEKNHADQLNKTSKLHFIEIE